MYFKSLEYFLDARLFGFVEKQQQDAKAEYCLSSQQQHLKLYFWR